jgi:hypothetical protein
MRSQEELLDELFIQLKDIKENTILKILENDLGIWYSVSCSTKNTSTTNLSILKSYGFVRNIKIKIDYGNSTFDSNSLSWTLDESFKFEVFPKFNSFFKKFGVLLHNPLLTKEERIFEIKKLFLENNLLGYSNYESNKSILNLKDVSFEYSQNLLKVLNISFFVNINEDSTKFLLVVLGAKGSIVGYEEIHYKIYGYGKEVLSFTEICKKINILKQRLKKQLSRYPKSYNNSSNSDDDKSTIDFLVSRIHCEKSTGYKFIQK